jgi:hypothetical protein
MPIAFLIIDATCVVQRASWRKSRPARLAKVIKPRDVASKELKAVCISLDVNGFYLCLTSRKAKHLAISSRWRHDGVRFGLMFK